MELLILWFSSNFSIVFSSEGAYLAEKQDGPASVLAPEKSSHLCGVRTCVRLLSVLRLVLGTAGPEQGP